MEKYPRTPKFLRELDPRILLSNNYVLLDFETTNIDYGDPVNPKNRLVMGQWKTGPDHKYPDRFCYIYGDELSMGPLLDDIESADLIIAHNAKFELGWLRRCGLDLRDKMCYCTQVTEYVIKSNRQGRLRLDDVAKRYGIGMQKNPYVSSLIKSGVCPSKIPKDLLIRYGMQDVRMLPDILEAQRKVLVDEGLLAPAYSRNLATPMLTDMEFQGLFLDRERVREEHDRVRREYIAVSREFDELTGGANFRSPKQKAELFFETLKFQVPKDERGNPYKTKTGLLATNQEVIKKLKPKTKKQKIFLDLLSRLNKLGARLSKTLEFFKGIVDHRGSTFYGEFNQTITRTQRLSSSGKGVQVEGWDAPKKAQLQNLPREYKPLFMARHSGWDIIEADGAQLEFRVGIGLANDESGISFIDDFGDVHALSASVFGIPRQQAKAHTFRPMYGGRGSTPAQHAYREAFQKAYPELYSMQNGWTFEVLENGSLTTPWGMKYYWPDTKMTKFGTVTNFQAIFNWPIQGLSAELVLIAAIHLWHYTRYCKLMMVNTIHDSVIAEVPKNERELFQELAVQCYTLEIYRFLKRVYGLDFHVPLGVDTKVGHHWSDKDSEETKVQYSPRQKKFFTYNSDKEEWFVYDERSEGSRH